MARQVLHFLAKLKKFENAMICEVESGILELPRERVVRIGVFPRANQTGETI